MYIRKDYPIIFEVKVGTLGVLRAVLMFCTDENETEDLYTTNVEPWDRRREGEKGEKDDDDIISEEEDEQGEEVNENTFKRRKSQTS